MISTSEQLELADQSKPEGMAIDGSERLAREAADWMESPHGRQIMRMIYAEVAIVLRDADGEQRISMDYIIHRLRFRLRKIRCRLARKGIPFEKSGGYALNDHHTAYISRHVRSRRPDWAQRFETRRVGKTKLEIVERKEITVTRRVPVQQAA